MRANGLMAFSLVGKGQRANGRDRDEMWERRKEKETCLIGWAERERENRLRDREIDRRIDRQTDRQIDR